MKRMMMIVLIGLLSIQAVFALQASINDYDPRPAEAGKYVNVWLKVENPTSTEAQKVLVTVVPKDGLELAQGEKATRSIATLGSYDYTILEYRLRVANDALDGANYLEVTLENKDTDFSTDLAIMVEEKDRKDVDLEVADIDSEPLRIRPGDDNVKLSVKIQNLGDGLAKGVKTRLQGLPAGMDFSESYSDRALIGNIDEDGLATAEFYIDVEDSVQSGEYVVMMVIDYKFKPDEDEDEYVIKSVELPVTISVKESPQYEIVKAVLDRDVLRAGDQNVKLQLTIRNVGEEQGESVRVKAYGKSEQPLEFDVNNNFVAPSLAPGESGQATLEFDVDEDAALQVYTLDIEIKNVVDGDVITYAQTLPIKVELPKQTGRGGFIIAGVVVVAIAIIGRVLTRKPKKRK